MWCFFCRNKHQWIRKSYKDWRSSLSSVSNSKVSLGFPGGQASVLSLVPPAPPYIQAFSEFSLPFSGGYLRSFVCPHLLSVPSGLLSDSPCRAQPLFSFPHRSPGFPISVHAAQAWNSSSSHTPLVTPYVQAGTKSIAFSLPTSPCSPPCTLSVSLLDLSLVLSFCDRMSSQPSCLQSLLNPLQTIDFCHLHFPKTWLPLCPFYENLQWPCCPPYKVWTPDPDIQSPAQFTYYLTSPLSSPCYPVTTSGAFQPPLPQKCCLPASWCEPCLFFQTEPQCHLLSEIFLDHYNQQWGFFSFNPSSFSFKFRDIFAELSWTSSPKSVVCMSHLRLVAPWLVLLCR